MLNFLTTGMRALKEDQCPPTPTMRTIGREIVKSMTLIPGPVRNQRHHPIHGQDHRTQHHSEAPFQEEVEVARVPVHRRDPWT